MDLHTLKDKPPWKWPRNAGGLLLKFLRDSTADPADRLLAAELAGDFTVINNRLASELLRILQNAKEFISLRIRAAKSLGPALEYACTYGLESGDSAISPVMVEEIKAVFHRLYKDTDVPREVRRRVLELSVRTPQGWHPEAVRAAYLGDDRDFKLTAIFCMGFIPGFDNEIMEAMAGDDPALCHEAARAAENWQVDTDWLDIDSPLTSGEDDYSLFEKAIRATTGFRSPETDGLRDFIEDPGDGMLLDKLQDVLEMDDLPWDDEFIEIDEDDDSLDL